MQGIRPQREQIDRVLYPCLRCGNFWLAGVPTFARGDLRHRLARSNGAHRRAVLSHIVRRQAGATGTAVLDIATITDQQLDASLPDPQQMADGLIFLIADHQADLFSSAVFSYDSLAAFLGLPIQAAPEEGIGWLISQFPGNRFEAVHLPNDFISFRLSAVGWQLRQELLFWHRKPGVPLWPCNSATLS